MVALNSREKCFNNEKILRIQRFDGNGEEVPGFGLQRMDSFLLKHFSPHEVDEVQKT